MQYNVVKCFMIPLPQFSIYTDLFTLSYAFTMEFTKMKIISWAFLVKKKKKQSEEERDQVFIMLSNEGRIYFIKDSFENIMKAQGDITKCSKDSVS